MPDLTSALDDLPFVTRRTLLSAGWGGLALLASGAANARKAVARRPHYPLPAGRHYWMPQVAPDGPVLAVVNLRRQMVQVFRNGVAIGFSSVSTGKNGYRTPTGLYPVLEMRRFHRSSTYNNAPMPWMVRLTWSGVALHAGALPGYPASHGCIRLPAAFAPKLFGVFARNDLVWIVNHSDVQGESPMTMLAPITPEGRALLVKEAVELPAYWNAAYEPSPTAPQPLSVLVSLSQRRLFVLRQGLLLASAALPSTLPEVALNGGALFAWQGVANGAGSQWQAADGNAQAQPALADALLPASGSFAQRLHSVMASGSQMLVAHLPAFNDLHWQTPA